MREPLDILREWWRIGEHFSESFFAEMGIPFTDPAERATRPAWTAIRTRWQASTTRAPSKEMEQWFRDEAACRTYIRRLR